MRIRVFVVILLIVVSAVGAVGGEAPEAAVRFAFLHVNDSHGRIEPYVQGGTSVGGYARLATAVREQRAKGGVEGLFLVHAGDLFSRGDALTRRTLGAANVALLNHLRFDAWTPGNGEFYDGVPNLRKRIAEASFAVLTANVALKETGKCLARPYVIEQAGPVRVAVFGLCFVRTGYASAKPLDVADPVTTARELVPRLRKEADVVVALTHLGIVADQLLVANVRGLDLVIGGHSHTKLSAGKRVKDPDGREVLIVQAGDYMQYLGRVDLVAEKHGDGYRVQEARARLIALDETVTRDPETASRVAEMAVKAGVTPPDTEK